MHFLSGYLQINRLKTEIPSSSLPVKPVSALFYALPRRRVSVRPETFRRASSVTCV